MTILKQESVSLPTNNVIATPVTPESDSVQEDILITPTRVETKQSTHQIMATSTSKPWDTSWYSDKERNEISDLHIDIG